MSDCPTNIADGVPALFVCEIFGDAGGDWYLEFLMLICLHHQQNPEDERNQAYEAEESGSQAECAQPAHQHETRSKEKNPKNDVNNVKTAEDHDRLRRVKANEWPLVDQKENNPGDPSKKIRQERRYIFGHA
jgi:hypothetical protein